jgi:transcriptional regulator with XRE-family HTH domain
MARQATRHLVTPPSPLPQRIREAQRVAGKTNDEVATGIGVGVRLYLKWKAGTVVPSYPNLHRLAQFFELPLAWFFEEAA